MTSSSATNQDLLPLFKSSDLQTKHELCILELLKAGKLGVNKPGTPHMTYGESCLPTTISELGIKRGLIIDRKKKKHINRNGGLTSFTQYWLKDHSEAIKAIELLNYLRKKRNAPQLNEEEAYQLLINFPEHNNPNTA